MAKYVPDSKTQRWVVIAPARTRRPDEAEVVPIDKSKTCAFCPGHESETPPEVYRLGPDEKDKPGWLVRVVPNKYPITDVHEVIIHSPDHEKDFENLDSEQVTRIIFTYRDRYRAHEPNGQVLIFCNHGLHAGASLTHPHSQLVAVPKQINLDVVSREPVNNLVEDNKYFLTYCPDFSQWPYEIWLAPKVENSRFGDITDEQLPDLARILQKTIRRIVAVYENPQLAYIHHGVQFGYNFYIYPAENWYLRLIPRFVHRAGFELGTGLNVNIVDPTVAALHLINAKI